MPRTGHTATALSDGRILITGGRDADGNLVAASEIFDHETTVNNINEETYTDIPDVAFRWSSDKWIFNMATSNLQKNTTYTFRINLKDGSYIQFSAGTK